MVAYKDNLFAHIDR